MLYRLVITLDTLYPGNKVTSRECFSHLVNVERQRRPFFEPMDAATLQQLQQQQNLGKIRGAHGHQNDSFASIAAQRAKNPEETFKFKEMVIQDDENLI